MPGYRAGAVPPAHREPFDHADRPSSAGDDPADDGTPDHDAGRAAPYPDRPGRPVHEIAVIEHHAAGVGRPNDDPRGAGAEALSGFGMNALKIAALLGAVALLATGGCAATPPPAPLEGVGHTGANTAKRGTPAFCRYYAGQAFTEKYRQTANTEQPETTEARASGDDAYRRCLAGQTN